MAMLANKKYNSKYIWTPDNPTFNYFTDIPQEHVLKNPYEEFITICQMHPAWGAKYIIGNGTFDMLPFQGVLLDILWKHTFPLIVASRGGGKTFIIATYCLLKAILSQNNIKGEKIVLVGSAFRQSKMIFNEIVRLIKMSPLIEECKPQIITNTDQHEITIGNSTITAIPLGTGEKVRGYRATIVVADEYAKINEEIFNTVILGFAAVAADPVKRAREIAKMKKKINDEFANMTNIELCGDKNQIILASTAWFRFNHLYKTFEKYMAIIQNKILGNAKDYKEILGDSAVNQMIDYRDYAVCKLPYTEIDEGFMDSNIISQAAQRLNKTMFAMEYLAEFPSDTDGFFKRSLIEACTPKHEPDVFAVELMGDGVSHYVLSADPARIAGRDNFAICVGKVQDKKVKLVYMKTYNGTQHRIVADDIRMLVDMFNIQAIAIDKAGGGQTVADLLADPKLSDGKELIFDKNDKNYDRIKGKHIIELINYQGEWLRNANFNLKAALENKTVLFPGKHNEENYIHTGEEYTGSDMEKVNDTWQEFEDAKDELSSVEMTETGNQTLHFDLKTGGADGEQIAKRKDRYSAILMCHYIAQQFIKSEDITPDETSRYGDLGGYIEEFN